MKNDEVNAKEPQGIGKCSVVEVECLLHLRVVHELVFGDAGGLLVEHPAERQPKGSEIFTGWGRIQGCSPGYVGQVRRWE